MNGADPRPLIAHVVHRFDVGGLENGIVNLINRMPADQVRHAVIALTDCSTFADRIEREDVRCWSLGKKPGQDPAALYRLYRLFRRLRPDIVHTRNIGTIECQVPALFARVPVRIHGEHGWDTYDPDGRNPRYRMLRRALSPIIDRYVVLSSELEIWLRENVGINSKKVVRICNGVDLERIRPVQDRDFQAAQHNLTIGTVSRLSEIKDPLNTLEAFYHLRQRLPGGQGVRLTFVGDGPMHDAVAQRVNALGLSNSVDLVAAQDDVPGWLRRFDVFVLGSRREGISNTILEAMSAGLPVVATRTGGNPELVDEGVTGFLVPPESAEALAGALECYVKSPELRAEHGRAARRRAEERFSLRGMVDAYSSLYGELHGAKA
jgi:sugar transferase (PEP-CTERM/EpsH1 system associated)